MFQQYKMQRAYGRLSFNATCMDPDHSTNTITSNSKYHEKNYAYNQDIDDHFATSPTNLYPRKEMSDLHTTCDGMSEDGTTYRRSSPLSSQNHRNREMVHKHSIALVCSFIQTSLIAYH